MILYMSRKTRRVKTRRGRKIGGYVLRRSATKNSGKRIPKSSKPKLKSNTVRQPNPVRTTTTTTVQPRTKTKTQPKSQPKTPNLLHLSKPIHNI